MNKLFIVEDEAIIRKGLVHNIPWEQWGFSVCGEAVNGRKALEYILHHAVDVVMTDVRMPVMDGLELAKLVKAFKPEVKIVVLTGFSDFEYARQSLEYGVFQYILKPLKRDKLEEVFLKLKELLDKERLDARERTELLERASEGQRALLQRRLADWIHGRYEELPADPLPGYPELSGLGRARLYACAIIDMDNQDCMDGQMVSLYNKQARSTAAAAATTTCRGTGLPNDIISGVDDLGRLTIIARIDEAAAGSTEEEILHKQLAEAVQAVKTALSETWRGASFSAGIGHFANTAEGVPDSYEKAAEALECRFYTGPSSLHFYRSISGASALTQQQFQQFKLLEKRLINFLSTGSGELDVILDEGFADLARQQSVAAQVVKNTTAQMLYSVLGYLSEQAHDTDLDMLTDLSMTGLTDLQHVKSFAKRIIMEIKSERDKSDQGTARNLVRQAMEYVSAHYAADFNLTDLADRLYVNSSYFSWLFKQETGQTSTAYLTQYRINMAKELLKQDKRKVYEVAQCVGYNDYRHFCKMFKKLEGISPKVYKQRGI